MKHTNNSKYPEVLTEKESKRFWSKVDKNGPFSLERKCPGRCWIWTAGKQSKGYGTFGLRKKNVLAHRLSYIVSNGVILDNLVLDHLCRNHICVNPKHLEAVKERDNVRRGTMMSRQLSKTHCPRGHSLNEFNLVKSGIKRGSRQCKACHRTSAKYSNSRSRGIELDLNLFQQIADDYYHKMLKEKDHFI